MNLLMQCALIPPLCRLAEDATVREALAEEDFYSLARAMGRHPADARAVVSLLTEADSSDPDPHMLRRCLSGEALALFHLCAQCGAGEMLAVLSRCTVSPTTEALALLIGEYRRAQAMARYALQLLWRLNGDEALPDALALFPQEGAPARSAQDVTRDLIRRLKGGSHD